MDWQIELMRTLVEMVKTGGGYAIWGIMIFWVMQLAKVGLVGWLAYLILKLVFFNINNYVSLRFLARKDSVSLLSHKVSKTLMSSLEDYQHKTTSSLKGFMKDVKDLLKESKGEKLKEKSKKS